MADVMLFIAFCFGFFLCAGQEKKIHASIEKLQIFFRIFAKEKYSFRVFNSS